MFLPVWRKWLNRLARTEARKGRRLPPEKSRRSQRLHLEQLEDRLTPATNITVIPGAAGTGSASDEITRPRGRWAATRRATRRGARRSMRSSLVMGFL